MTKLSEAAKDLLMDASDWTRLTYITDERQRKRAFAVAMVFHGVPIEATCGNLDVSAPSVYRWCGLFKKHGAIGLQDRRGPPPKGLDVTPSQRQELTRIAHDCDLPSHVSARARMMLMRADGKTTTEIGPLFGVSPSAVDRWSKKFLAGGTAGLFGSRRPRAEVKLYDRDRRELEARATSDDTCDADRIPAQILLLCDQGLSNKAVARRLSVGPRLVTSVTRKFVASGLAGLPYSGLQLRASEKKILESWRGDAGLTRKERVRAASVLLSAEGKTMKQIATELGTTQQTVRWAIGLYKDKGIDGLLSSWALRLTDEQRLELEREASRPLGGRTDPRRVQIVLAKGNGMPTSDIAREFRRSPAVVKEWIKRYREKGIEGLRDKPQVRRAACPPICLSDEEQEALEAVKASHTATNMDQLRAIAVLLRNQNVGRDDIASRVGVPRGLVQNWLKRYNDTGLEGFQRPKRSGE